MATKEKPVLSRGAIVVLFVSVVALLVCGLWWLSDGQLFRLFETRGQIADRQRTLIIFTTLLSLVVLLPTYFMLYVFAWRYREGHKKQYKPNWDSNKLFEFIWWAVPIIFIGILAVVTYVTSHSLDPYKPLASAQKPIQVQVVALNWKWLFVYPEEGVASVNEFALPLNRPVELSLTSDGPMGSFWLPELAGQVYVMSGMSTKLHIDAHKPGVYDGVNANITGKGYADMRFRAKALDDEGYKTWLRNAGNSNQELTASALKTLRAESVKNPVRYYYFDRTQTSAFTVVLHEYMTMNPPQSKAMYGDEKASPSDRAMEHAGHNMEGM